MLFILVAVWSNALWDLAVMLGAGDYVKMHNCLPPEPGSSSFYLLTYLFLNDTCAVR